MNFSVTSEADPRTSPPLPIWRNLTSRGTLPVIFAVRKVGSIDCNMSLVRQQSLLSCNLMSENIYSDK